MAYLANIEVKDGYVLGYKNGKKISSNINKTGLYTPTNNTVLYWPLDRYDFGIVKDGSGNGFDGTCSGTGLTFQETGGIQGGPYFEFNIDITEGVQTYPGGQVTSIYNVPTFDSYTMSLWRKKYRNTDWAQYITIGDEDTHIGFGQCNNHFNIYPGPSYNKYASNMPDDQNWHHMLISYDGITEIMSIYFDGVKQYSSPDTEFDNWPKALTNYRKPLVVGGGVQNEAKNQPWDYHYLYGALSEVIYENKAWTQQEVIDYYNTFQ